MAGKNVTAHSVEGSGYDPHMGSKNQNPRHMDILSHFGIDPIFHDVKDALHGFEPEGKLQLNTRGCINECIEILSTRRNTLFIPEQCSRGRKLVSLHLDNSNRTLQENGISLRLRGTVGDDGRLTNADINEKTVLGGDTRRLLNGMVMREEREAKIDLSRPGRIADNFRQIVEEFKRDGSPFHCTPIAFNDLRVQTITTAPRMNFSVFLKDPDRPVGALFHMCYDPTLFYTAFGAPLNNQNPMLGLEMEIKGLYGDIGHDSVRDLSVRTLNRFTATLHKSIHGATIDHLSKIEHAAAMLRATEGGTMHKFNRGAHCAMPTLQAVLDHGFEFTAKGKRTQDQILDKARTPVPADRTILPTTGKHLVLETDLMDLIALQQRPRLVV